MLTQPIKIYILSAFFLNMEQLQLSRNFSLGYVHSLEKTHSPGSRDKDFLNWVEKNEFGKYTDIIRSVKSRCGLDYIMKNPNIDEEMGIITMDGLRVDSNSTHYLVIGLSNGNVLEECIDYYDKIPLCILKNDACKTITELAMNGASYQEIFQHLLEEHLHHQVLLLCIPF